MTGTFHLTNWIYNEGDPIVKVSKHKWDPTYILNMADRLLCNYMYTSDPEQQYVRDFLYSHPDASSLFGKIDIERTRLLPNSKNIHYNDAIARYEMASGEKVVGRTVITHLSSGAVTTKLDADVRHYKDEHFDEIMSHILSYGGKASLVGIDAEYFRVADDEELPFRCRLIQLELDVGLYALIDVPFLKLGDRPKNHWLIRMLTSNHVIKVGVGMLEDLKVFERIVFEALNLNPPRGTNAGIDEYSLRGFVDLQYMESMMCFGRMTGTFKSLFAMKRFYGLIKAVPTVKATVSPQAFSRRLVEPILVSYAMYDVEGLRRIFSVLIDAGMFCALEQPIATAVLSTGYIYAQASSLTPSWVRMHLSAARKAGKDRTGAVWDWHPSLKAKVLEDLSEAYLITGSMTTANKCDTNGWIIRFITWLRMVDEVTNARRLRNRYYAEAEKEVPSLYAVNVEPCWDDEDY